MKQQPGIPCISLFCLLVTLSIAPLWATDDIVQSEINNYYLNLDASFANIVDASTLQSTNLRPAERLFVREIRKNLSFNTFFRTNSKGMIISEVIRGQEIKRPMRKVSNQRWFRSVSRHKEPYYTLIKDDDHGRYYLFWARPILSRGDNFIGAVVAKIDLWDSFYEYSNSVYFPFLITLGRTSLFSHKWKEKASSTTKTLSIQGIERISITYAEPYTTTQQSSNKDTVEAKQVSVDTVKSDTAMSNADVTTNKKDMPGLLIFLIALFVIGLSVALFMGISAIRRRALLKKIDDEDNFFK